MLNLNELETKWFYYKIKSYIPHTVTLISLIIIISLVSSFNFTSQEVNLKEEMIQESDSKAVAKKTIIDKVISEPVQQKAINEDAIVLKDKSQKTTITPSMGFIRTMQYNSPVYYSEEPTVAKKSYTKKTKVKKKEQIPKPIKEEIVVKAPEIEIVEKTSINIKRQDAFNDIEHVIKRFKKSNNPALSLFVAKKYYELKDYNQAYNYSLITNGINNNIEDSWMIFAKSLVKLDKKDQAIEILNKYINNSNSQKAKLLIENIKSGRLQ